MADTTPWVLKYSPKKIDEMVLSPELTEMFKNIVETQKLSNLAIFGNPGIGKTTLSKILVDSIDCEYWLQPCSIDGSIDMVKSTIKDFCDIIPKGMYKVVILDEADQLSQQAQMALRNIIVDSMDNCRFILTANYQDKLIDALKSRCTPVKLEFSAKDVLKHCVKILNQENVKYEKDVLKDFYEEIITKKYPDVRTIIEHLQMMSLTGTLKMIKSTETVTNDEIIEFICDGIKKKSIKDIRQYLLLNEDKFSADYVSLAQKLFDAFDTSAEAMAVIADALWRMSFQLDKEIQFTGMLINLKNILK